MVLGLCVSFVVFLLRFGPGENVDPEGHLSWFTLSVSKVVEVYKFAQYWKS